MRLNRTLDDLPDDILGRILALLPTEDRAMSEAVSKSWRRASLGRDWERICLDPLGLNQVKWLKRIADYTRAPCSLHVFEGHFQPEMPVLTALHCVGCFQNLKHLELKRMSLDPSRMQTLSHLTNLEWLGCDYAPSGVEDDEIDEGNDVRMSIDLNDFANFSQLRHLTAVLRKSHLTGQPIWKVSLGSRFQGLTQLRSLKLGYVHTLHVDANLLQVAARLENFELKFLRNELSLEGQALETPQLTRFVYNVNPLDEGPLNFPLKAAPQLLELTLHGDFIEPVTLALDICPKLTALDLNMGAHLLAEDVREWPVMSTLRSLDVFHFEPSYPYVLLPFSAHPRLERLTLYLDPDGKRPALLASPDSMQHLKVLVLDGRGTEPFNLGGGLNHLQGLKTLHLTMPILKGEIKLKALEVLKVSFEAFRSDVKSGHQLIGNLSRLHTLHIVAEFRDATEILLIAHAIGTLRSLRDLVLLRLSRYENALSGFTNKDLGFTMTMLRAVSNTANMYNHVVIMDHGAVLLERSSMPHARHLELACSSISLDSEQAEEDWFHRTNSLRIRLPISSITFQSFESAPASVVERLGCSPCVKIRRIQRIISPSRDGAPTPSYTDYIEASKYEFSSLPPKFCVHELYGVQLWSLFSGEYQDWD